MYNFASVCRFGPGEGPQGYPTHDYASSYHPSSHQSTLTRRETSAEVRSSLNSSTLRTRGEADSYAVHLKAWGKRQRINPRRAMTKKVQLTNGGRFLGSLHAQVFSG
jgi:hypothetical protein